MPRSPQIQLALPPDVLAELRLGVVPNKLSYVGGGADLWCNLDDAWTKTGNTSRERELLTGDTAKAIFSSIALAAGKRPVSMHDYGCGNGQTAVIVGKTLRERESGLVVDQYHAYDISQPMITRAQRRVRETLGGVITRSAVVDFENDELKPLNGTDDRLRVGLFLGNTIGNYLDPTGILRNLRGSLQQDDLMLVGSTLPPEEPEQLLRLLETYTDPAELELLTQNANRLGLPMDVSGTRVAWDEERTQVNVFGTILTDTRIHAEGTKPQDSEALTLKEGAELELLVSRRYRENKITEFLLAAGMNPIVGIQNEAATNLVTLARVN